MGRVFVARQPNVVPVYSFPERGSLQAVCMPYRGPLTRGHLVSRLRNEYIPTLRGRSVATVPLKQLVPGKVSCRQVDADARVAGFQKFTVAGKMVARCTAGGQDLSTLLLAEQGPQLRDKPRSRGVWARRVDMTRTWLVAGK